MLSFALPRINFTEHQKYQYSFWSISPNVGESKISPKRDTLLPHTGGNSSSQSKIQGKELLMYGMQAL